MSKTQKAVDAYKAPKTRVFFGKDIKAGENIYLTLPTFDCDWYWGFGYLGNKNLHFPLSSYQEELATGETRNINMFDSLKRDYELCDALQDDKALWVFCELALTIYTLIDVAGIHNRGGSHFATNPCKDLLKSPEQYEHINFVLLPALFKEMDKVLGVAV